MRHKETRNEMQEDKKRERGKGGRVEEEEVGGNEWVRDAFR